MSNLSSRLFSQGPVFFLLLFLSSALSPLEQGAIPLQPTLLLAEESSPSTPQPTLLSRVNDIVGTVIFFDITGSAVTIPEVTFDGTPVTDPKTGEQRTKNVPFPLIVALLAFGSVFFTFYYGWVNLRGFWHAIQITCGKFDKDQAEGDVTHFRALTSALSATVGLGNIAGVALAVQLGGPGALFWMLFLALFGMSAKYSSCTLAQMYRRVNRDGSISGGPMYYLDIGIRGLSPSLAPIGKGLGVLYAICIMGGSFGGGTMFQANQTAEAIVGTFGLSPAANHIIGGVLALFVALVVLGGIKRIGAATSRIVPFMCGIYVSASIIILIAHASAIPSALQTILRLAFVDNAFYGGLLGVVVMGFRRAAFSNEAGLGSAAIAHAAAKTKEPVREGLVAMLEPFIDTIIICFMTGMVIVVTGVYADPAITQSSSNVGVTLTASAFTTVLPWFHYILTLCITLFAYSTMISWCYYGERGWIYLLDHISDGLGLKTLFVYRIMFILFTYLGAINSLDDVVTFTDLMILSLAFPNILGSLFLAPQVKKATKKYFQEYLN